MQLLLTLLRTHCMVAPRPFLTSNAHVLITLRGYNLSANTFCQHPARPSVIILIGVGGRHALIAASKVVIDYVVDYLVHALVTQAPDEQTADAKSVSGMNPKADNAQLWLLQSNML